MAGQVRVTVTDDPDEGAPILTDSEELFMKRGSSEHRRGTFAAIDLGAYISLGTSKGKIVRVALALIVGTAIMWFIFFGDIEKLKNMNTEMIFEWITAHQFELSLSEILGPFAVLAIYYLSYRISCHFSNKGAY